MATAPTSLPTETPAETPAPEAKDLRTAEEIALTSHLSSAPPSPEADSVQGEEAETIPAIKLPKTAKEAHELLAKVQAQEVKTPADAAKKKAQIAALAAHIHELGQGITAKPITAKAHSALSNAATGHAVEIHILQLRRTDMILDGYLKNLEAKIAELTAAKK